MKYTGCYGRVEIEGFIPPENSVLICIHDPDTFYPKVNRAEQGWHRIHFHQFWDVERPQAYGIVKYEPASEKQLLALKESLDMSLDGHIFVSCEAGISRASAVREYLLCRGWTPYGREQQDRMVSPNQHILSGLERLDVPSSLEHTTT